MVGFVVSKVVLSLFFGCKVSFVPICIVAALIELKSNNKLLLSVSYFVSTISYELWIILNNNSKLNL